LLSGDAERSLVLAGARKIVAQLLMSSTTPHVDLIVIKPNSPGPAARFLGIDRQASASCIKQSAENQPNSLETDARRTEQACLEDSRRRTLPTPVQHTASSRSKK